MIKVVSVLCLLAVVVYAKPAIQEKTQRKPTLLEVIYERPNIPDTIECDIDGRFALATGENCDGNTQTFSCNGKCIDVTQIHRSMNATGFAAPYHASVSFFTEFGCLGDFVGTANCDADTCYVVDKNSGIETAKSFTCSLIKDPSKIVTLQPSVRKGH